MGQQAVKVILAYLSSRKRGFGLILGEETSQVWIALFEPAKPEVVKPKAQPKAAAAVKGKKRKAAGGEEVAEKILRHSESLGGISRFSFQMDNAKLSHNQLMESIKLIGQKVSPIVNG